jgi:hypothetical protein
VKTDQTAEKLSIIGKWHQDQSCLFWQEDYWNKDHNIEKLSWFRVPVKMVSVAQKLSMIEERHQGQSCLFQQGDYRNKGHNPKKTVTGSSPGEDSFFSSEIKHDRRKAPRPKLFVLAGRLQKQRP